MINRSFKDYMKNEFIGFVNSGGNPDNYKNFNSSPELMVGYGGGFSDNKIVENLNPREKPLIITGDKHYLEDPDKTSEYYPESTDIQVHPYFNNEHSNHIKKLLNNTDTANIDYQNIIKHYTTNSFNLNNTLIEYHRNNKKPPNIIRSNDNINSDIDIRKLDTLINRHSLPEDMTVYSGIHFHPLQHIGKIARLPAYLSTSLSPHVSKDFGLYSDYFDKEGNKQFVKNILRIHLPKGSPHLFTDPASIIPGQGELILPRNMKMQLGQQPTHIITGIFNNHFSNKPTDLTSYHMWTGRILT